jgi:branched-chain amino acid transport system permease protein
MRHLYKKYKVILILIAALLLPVFVDNPYALHVANLAGIFAILTLSLNLLTGCTGLFSVGHAAFYGIGAYTSAILTVKLGLPIWAGFIAAGVVAALFGLALGLPTLRLRGLYLAVATLAFGEIMYQVFVNWEAVTNGTKGITGVPAPQIGPFLLNSYRSYYYLILVVLVVVVVLSQNLIKSRVGRALLAIREDQMAAEAMGVNSTKFKVIAFMSSAFFAGIAGSLYVHEVRFLSPETFISAESAAILAMMVVGGIGHIPGSILGGIALTVIPEYLRSFGDLRLVLYGASIVIIVIFVPRGIGGAIDFVDELISGTRSLKKTKQRSRVKEV